MAVLKRILLPRENQRQQIFKTNTLKQNMEKRLSMRVTIVVAKHNYTMSVSWAKQLVSTNKTTGKY